MDRKQKKIPITITMNKEQWANIKAVAKKRGISASALIGILSEAGLNKIENAGKDLFDLLNN